MGTIDSATITITCPQCGLTESDRILDKGNPFGGWDWGKPTFTKFETQVTGGGKEEPEVRASCPTCKVPAMVNHDHP